MKIAKANRKRNNHYFSLDELQKLLVEMGIEEKGMTKSGEKILSYEGNEFTITKGNTEGFDIDKVADKIAFVLTKIRQGYVPGTKPLDAVKEEDFRYAYEKLKRTLGQIGFG